MSPVSQPHKCCPPPAEPAVIETPPQGDAHDSKHSVLARVAAIVALWLALGIGAAEAISRF